MAHQGNVHHRGLVHDQQVALQRAPFVAGEAAAARVHLQQPVNGFGLEAGGLGQAARGPAGRSAQEAAHLLGPEDAQDGVDQRGFAHARAAGNNEQTLSEGLPQGRLLAGSQLQARLLKIINLF